MCIPLLPRVSEESKIYPVSRIHWALHGELSAAIELLLKFETTLRVCPPRIAIVAAVNWRLVPCMMIDSGCSRDI